MPINSQPTDIIILNSNDLSTMLLVPDFDFGDPKDGFAMQGSRPRTKSEPVYLSFFYSADSIKAMIYLTEYEQHATELSRTDIEHLVYLLASRAPNTTGKIIATKMCSLDYIISYSGNLFRSDYKGDVTKAHNLTQSDGTIKREWQPATNTDIVKIIIKLANRIFTEQ